MCDSCHARLTFNYGYRIIIYTKHAMIRNCLAQIKVLQEIDCEQ